MFSEKYFYSENDVEKRDLLPGVSARLIWGDLIMMGVIDIEPDVEVPEHSHINEQCGRVLEGSAWFYVGESKERLEAGDHYVIPADVPHRVVATSAGCVALDIWSPIREEYISDKVRFFDK